MHDSVKLLLAGLAMFAGLLIAGYTTFLSLEPKHPTYHCDASDKLGYAAPGTPEARACWIEERK